MTIMPHIKDGTKVVLLNGAEGEITGHIVDYLYKCKMADGKEVEIKTAHIKEMTEPPKQKIKVTPVGAGASVETKVDPADAAKRKELAATKVAADEALLKEVDALVGSA